MIKTGTLLIWLTSHTLHAAWTRRGGVVGAVRKSVPKGATKALWDGNSEALDGVLAEITSELRVPSGSATRVFYTGPDTILEMFTLPVSGDEAAQAAELALADLARFSLHAHPSSTARFTIGRREANSTQMIGAADRNETLEALAAWVEKAGLRVEALVPARLGNLVAAAEGFDRIASSGPVVSIAIGRDSTALLGGTGDRVAFARVIELGLERIVEAIEQAFAEASVDTGDESFAHAEDVFLESGIRLGTQGSAEQAPEPPVNYMPHLQPVLQRLIVETKQTIRFGLQDDRDAVVLLTGPAAAVPGLRETLANQLELDVEIEPGADDPGVLSRTSLPAVIRGRVPRIGMLPRRLEDTRLSRSMGRVVFAGTVFAGLLLGTDAMLTKAATDRVQQAIAEGRPVMQTIHEHQLAEEQAVALASRIEHAERELRETLPARSNWDGFLLELGRLGSEQVRLIEVRGRTDRGATVVTLDGLATGAGGGGDDPVGAYMRSLRDSPLVRDVRVGSTRRTEIGGSPATRFSLEAELVMVPTLAAMREGGDS